MCLIYFGTVSVGGLWPIFLIGLFIYWLLNFKSSLYFLNKMVFYQICHLLKKIYIYFLPVCGFSSYSINIVLCSLAFILSVQPRHRQRNWILGKWIVLCCSGQKLQRWHLYSLTTILFPEERSMILQFGVLTEMKVKVKSFSCVQFCDLKDYSWPGSSIHGIFQARVLEWVAVSFSI